MPLAEDDALNIETRARRSLGLTTNSPSPPQQAQQARHRHHFVRDGEVPVVVLSKEGKSNANSRARDHLTDVLAALDAERAARASATRSVGQTRATIQSLRARLAHAELAFGEAVAVERQARASAEKALEKAVAPKDTPDQAAAPAEGSTGPSIRQPPVHRIRTAMGPKATAEPRQREPRPVKWWTAGYRAQRRER